MQVRVNLQAETILQFLKNISYLQEKSTAYYL